MDLSSVAIASRRRAPAPRTWADRDQCDELRSNHSLPQAASGGVALPLGGQVRPVDMDYFGSEVLGSGRISKAGARTSWRTSRVDRMDVRVWARVGTGARLHPPAGGRASQRVPGSSVQAMKVRYHADTDALDIDLSEQVSGESRK